MNNIDFLETEDELVFAIRDLRKMLFVIECYDLYRRGMIPNIDSCRYTEELIDDFAIELIGIMNDKALEIDVLSDNLFEWYRLNSEGRMRSPERTPCAGGASPTEGKGSD